MQPAELYRSPARRVLAAPLLPLLAFSFRFFLIIRAVRVSTMKSRLCASPSFYRLAVVRILQALGLPDIGRPFFW